MAVQFNLLPDVKLEFDRQLKAKRFVFTVSFLVSAAALAIFVISFLSVTVLQKKLLDNANNDINNYSQKLKAIPDLDKVLTIQNQLNALPGLHQQKHYTSRLFTYLPQITPVKTNIGKLTLDTTASTIDVAGTADTVQTINKFVDTLKFTGYTLAGKTDSKSCGDAGGTWHSDSNICTKLAFNNVLLTKVDRDDKGASYTIDASFDQALFTGSQSVTLIVPQETTTRSVINAPNASGPLFNGQTQTQTQAQKQGGQ
jgi:Tfp pilus assembly protein PilN